MSVPVFVNRSLLPHIAGVMSSKIIELLREYPGLEVYSGNSKKADAVLLGIISGDEKWEDFIKTQDTILVKVENRKDFYLPLNSSFGVNLRLVLIKNPQKRDLEIFTSKLAPGIAAKGKVLFNESLALEASIQRILETTDPANKDSGGYVNNTKNSYIFKRASLTLSEQAVQVFKQEVLSAF